MKVPALYALLCALYLFRGTLAQSELPCTDPVADCSADTDYFLDKPQIDYANQTIRSLTFKNTYVDVVIENGAVEYSVRMVRCGCEEITPQLAGANAQQFSVPPKGVYVGDTVIGSMLAIEVPALERIRAITAFYFNPQIDSRVQSGKIVAITQDSELVADGLDDSIDVAIVNGFGVASYTDAGVGAPYLLSAESAESNPIGRAEWIKIFGIMFDQVPTAVSTFESIVFRYNAVSQRAFSVSRRPSALLNVPFDMMDGSDPTWTLPGGEQYTSAFLQDANVDYRFESDGSTTGNTLTVGEVAEKFGSARFWINVGRFPALSDDTTVDFLNDTNSILADTYKSLAAVQCGNVWANSKKINEDGTGNDFFELGALRPDLVLTDLVKIFHPDVSTDDPFTFYYSMGAPANGQTAACPYVTLPTSAPFGRTYKLSALEVDGANRFQIEDNIPNFVAPAVAQAIGVDEDSVEIFFDTPSASTGADSAFVSIRSSLSNSKADDYDESVVRDAIVSGLADANFTVTARVLDTETLESSSSGRSVSSGGIAGSAIGSLLAILLLGLAGYWLFKRGARRGFQSGYDAVKEKFWLEHQLRLAEDAQDPEAAVKGIIAEGGPKK